MARHASSYRQSRREEWRLHNALDATKLTWAEFNQRFVRHQHDIKVLGNAASAFRPKPSKDYRGKLGDKDKARMEKSK